MRVASIRFQFLLDKFLTSPNTERDADKTFCELAGEPDSPTFADNDQCHNLRQ